MRKYISILVLSVFLFNIEGYYIWFCVLQYTIKNEIKQEIRRGLKEEDLVIISMPVENETGICWFKPNKEFRYKDEMYDVVKIRKTSQKTYYYCISDKKEKQLFSGLNKSQNTKKETEKKIKRTYTYPFYLQSFPLISYIYCIDFKRAGINNRYKSNAIDIHSPPPKEV